MSDINVQTQLPVFDTNFNFEIFNNFYLFFSDFLNQADGLFQSIDAKKTGKVDRVLCDTITQQLHQAVCGTTPDNPVS